MKRLDVIKNDQAYLQIVNTTVVSSKNSINTQHIPSDAYVLIGNKSAEYGGGLAGTGYVMSRNEFQGTIPISATDVMLGYILL